MNQNRKFSSGWISVRPSCTRQSTMQSILQPKEGIWHFSAFEVRGIIYSHGRNIRKDCNVDEKFMVMNYIAKDLITLTYCLLHAFYSLQEEATDDDPGLVFIVNVTKTH